MWIITVILFAGIIIFIIWYIRNRKKIMWQKHFEQHIKRHRYNKAAIMLNRKVYENVRAKSMDMEISQRSLTASMQKYYVRYILI